MKVQLWKCGCLPTKILQGSRPKKNKKNQGPPRKKCLGNYFDTMYIKGGVDKDAFHCIIFQQRTYLCPDPSCKLLPEADKPLSSDNAAKAAWAQDAATLGPTEEARKATYKNFPQVSWLRTRVKSGENLYPIYWTLQIISLSRIPFPFHPAYIWSLNHFRREL